MCGIAGMIDWRAATSADALRAIGEAMNETLRHRGPDGGGRLDRGRGRRDAGAAPPRHHRSQPRRRAADAVGRPALRHHLQRRDLQLSRHPQRACRRRPDDAQRFRHRGAARGLRAVGRRGGGRAHHRHVRVRAVGPHHAHAVAGARPARHQADVLRRAARPRCCSPRSSRRSAPRPAGGRPSTTMRSRAICATATSRSRARSIARPRSCRRAHPDGARRRGAEADLLLGCAAGRAHRAVAQRSGAGRGRGDRAARCAAARCRPAAHDRRRAARRVSLRRHRFLDRGRADAGAEHAAGEDLLDRLPCHRLRRGDLRQGRGGASGHRPHRVLCRAAARARPHPAARRMVRRAVRRLLRRSRPTSSRS